MDCLLTIRGQDSSVLSLGWNGSYLWRKPASTLTMFSSTLRLCHVYVGSWPKLRATVILQNKTVLLENI